MLFRERGFAFADDGRDFDAISIYEEWIVDGVDPQDDDYVFIFTPDLTLETEEK